MCGCDWNYVCVGCRDTRHDPGYLLIHLPDGDDPYEPETASPSEYEVLDG